MLGDFVERALTVRNPKSFAGDLLAVPRIGGAVENLLCEMEANPRAPRTDFRAGTADPTGEMLEMADWISEITAMAVTGFFQNPGQRLIGRRMGQQLRLAA